MVGPAHVETQDVFMAGLNAGDLDSEIILQEATRSRDEVTGQEVLTWADGDTLWAQWLPGSAREVWLARQIDSRIEGIYVIQWRDDIYPDVSQLTGHDGRTYDVVGVTEIGRQEGLSVAVVAKGENPA